MKKFTLFLSALLISMVSMAASYVKVTAAPADWSGEYLLVYEGETTTHVWTGVDAANGNVEATATDGTISGTDFVTITVAPMEGGYSIKVNGGANDGKYISGKSGDNKLNFGANAALNTLAYEDGSVKIVSNTSVMRFNSAKDNMRFRYFKSSSYTGQKVVQLYKNTDGTSPEEPENPDTPDTPEEPETPTEPEQPEGVITCAEAVAICQETGETATTESYTIRGYVTNIASAYNAGYNNTSFWMADTKDGGKVFEAFRSTPLAEADKAVKVGDYVEVTGNLVNYKGNTPETAQGGTYTILEAAEGGTTPEDPETPETPAETITIADGLALADNETCVLNPFTVIYVSGSYIYIEDESAYALLYQYNFGLKAGDKVTGLEVTKSTYQDIAQFKPVSTSLEGLTIVAGEAPEIDEITSAPTVADNHFVKLVNATLAGAIVANATVVATCSDNTTINIYSKSDYAIEEGKTYNIIGGVTQYKGVIQIQAYEVEEYVGNATTGIVVENILTDDNLVKVFENGQLIIIKNGVKYNAQGAILK